MHHAASAVCVALALALYHYCIRSNSPFYTIITDKLLLFNSRFLQPGLERPVSHSNGVSYCHYMYILQSLTALFEWLAKPLTRVLPLIQTNATASALRARTRTKRFFCDYDGSPPPPYMGAVGVNWAPLKQFNVVYGDPYS